MSKQSKGARIPLGEPLQSDLLDFCQAHYGVPTINIIRQAVRTFIDERLEAEPEMRKRYQAARKARLEGKNAKLIVIHSDDDNG